MVSAKTTKDGMRFEVLTAVLLMFHIFWDVTLSPDVWFLMFRTIVVPASSRVKQSKTTAL
jgi:hypothetical protein